MKVEILNQYSQKIKVHGNESTEVFRTSKTLEQLKESLSEQGIFECGEWSEDGKVVAVYGNVADSINDIDRVQEFNKKKHHVNFGRRGYYTLEEIKNADLVWIKGFGIVDDSNLGEIEKILEEYER